MTASTFARSARYATGLQQQRVSLRSAVAGSSLSLIEHGRRDPTVDTLSTILSATGHRLVTIPTNLSDAADISIDIADSLALGDRSRALRRFLQLSDNLGSVSGATRVGLTLTAPPPTADLGWDAALAAVCAWRLNQERLPQPQWVDDPRRRSAADWIVSGSRYSVSVDRARVPAEFLERGVLIEVDTLESA